VRTGIGLCDFGEAIVEVFMSLEEGSESKELRVESLVSSSPLCDFDSCPKCKESTTVICLPEGWFPEKKQSFVETLFWPKFKSNWIL
jgi:hypothetical protein